MEQDFFFDTQNMICLHFILTLSPISASVKTPPCLMLNKVCDCLFNEARPQWAKTRENMKHDLPFEKTNI